MLTLAPLNILALFGAMALLAALPSISVLAVTSRAATSGFAAGAAVSLGVVLGDIVFILVTVLGLAILVDALGPWFILVRLLGGGWLIWLGLSLWRAAGKENEPAASRHTSHTSGFITGLLLTLGDQKAIFFYLGFLPAFLDMSVMTALDIALVALAAAVSVGGVKLVYAWVAARAGQVVTTARHTLILGRLAASVLVAAGLVVMAGIEVT